MRTVDEIYKNVHDAVMEEIELPENWMTSKSEDCVDARYITVHYLCKSGLSRLQIQNKTGLAKTTIRQYINGYRDRKKVRIIINIWSNNIGRKLGIN